MDPISAGIIAGVSILIMLIVNLIKGTSIVVMLVNSLLGGVFIFMIVSGVQAVFTHVLKISITGSSDEKPGTRVDYTTEDTESSEDSEQDEQDTLAADRTDESGEDDSVGTQEDAYESSSESDSGGFVETDFSGMSKIDDYEKESESFHERGYDSSGYDIQETSSSKNMDELISDKMGFNATAEDMAKAIRTTLKRE